jgi:hypothetical protein
LAIPSPVTVTTAPLNPPIINTTFARALNHSHIAHSTAKLLAMPVGWNEMDGYDEVFSTTDARATRVFNGPWVTRHLFKQWALGYSFSVGNPNNVLSGNAGCNAPGTGILNRVIPAQHPEMPWLYASEVKLLDGLGGWKNNPYVGFQDECGNVTAVPGTGYATSPIPMIAYYNYENGNDANSCVYAVTYTDRDYEILEQPDPVVGEMGRYVTRHGTYASKALTIPYPRLKFTDGSGEVPEQGIFIVGTEEVAYTWHQVPDIPWGAIQNCVGKVNSGDFDGFASYPTFTAGTLLCLAPERERKRMCTGRIGWQITFRFLYLNTGSCLLQRGHNYFPKVDASGNLTFVLATYDGTQTGRGLYDKADFTTLFQPVSPGNYQTATLSTTSCP